MREVTGYLILTAVISTVILFASQAADFAETVRDGDLFRPLHVGSIARADAYDVPDFDEGRNLDN